MKNSVAGILLAAFAALGTAPAHAQVPSWLWWGANQHDAVPTSAANPLPVQPIGGGSGMLTDASNAQLPVATRNLGLMYTASTDAEIRDRLTAIGSAGGGTLFIQSGTYAPISPYEIPSNTHTQCEAGATFITSSVGHTGNKVTFENVGHAATSRTDHDITFSGPCIFQTAGTYATDGGFHHIQITATTRVTIYGSEMSFDGGGDATAMVGDDTTTIYAGTATNIYNACWDHWANPTQSGKNAIVIGGSCTTLNFGALFSGNDTAGDLGGVFDTATVIGGHYIVLSTSKVGIWVQCAAVGTQTGCGAKNVTIINPTIDMTGSTGSACVKISGGGSVNDKVNATCIGGSSTSVIVTQEGGGKPSQYTIDLVVVGSSLNTGGLAAVTMNGDNGLLNSLNIPSGTYTFIADGSGANVQANYTNISAAAGTTGLYNFSSGNNSQKTFIPATVVFGGVATDGTFSAAPTAWYERAGKLVCIGYSFTFSNLGTVTGNLQVVAAWPTQQADTRVEFTTLSGTTGLTTEPWALLNAVGKINFYAGGANRGAQLTNTALTNTASLAGSSCYGSIN